MGNTIIRRNFVEILCIGGERFKMRCEKKIQNDLINL